MEEGAVAASAAASVAVVFSDVRRGRIEGKRRPPK
jgi:hypothetical protein